MFASPILRSLCMVCAHLGPQMFSCLWFTISEGLNVICIWLFERKKPHSFWGKKKLVWEMACMELLTCYEKWRVWSRSHATAQAQSHALSHSSSLPVCSRILDEEETEFRWRATMTCNSYTVGSKDYGYPNLFMH